MGKEIIASNEGSAGGWFKCSECNYSVLLNGKAFYDAQRLESQKMPILCSSCSPNGFKPEIRKPKYPVITGFLYGGDGIG